MSVTDGDLGNTRHSEMVVSVEGDITIDTSSPLAVSGTVTANQGTAGTAAQGWYTRITDGTDTATVSGSALNVTSGIETAVVTLNALSAVGPGVVVDFGSAKSNVSMVFLGTVAAGTVVLDVSHDNSTWFQTGTPIAITTTPQNISVGSNAFRYARGRIAEEVTAGTVSATIMGA